jgi:hypothetical protein
MFKVLNYLSEEERFIREEVFCKEQGFVNEIDDLEDSSFHLLYYLPINFFSSMFLQKTVCFRKMLTTQKTIIRR